MVVGVMLVTWVRGLKGSMVWVWVQARGLRRGTQSGVQPKKHAPRPYVVVGLPFKSVCCSKGGVSPVTAHAVSDEVDGLSLNTTFTLSVDIQGNKGVKFFV